MNTDSWFWGFCTVCKINFSTTFRDSQRLPKSRREIYLEHRAKSPKPRISIANAVNNITDVTYASTSSLTKEHKHYFFFHYRTVGAEMCSIDDVTNKTKESLLSRRSYVTVTRTLFYVLFAVISTLRDTQNVTKSHCRQIMVCRFLSDTLTSFCLNCSQYCRGKFSSFGLRSGEDKAEMTVICEGLSD